MEVRMSCEKCGLEHRIDLNKDFKCTKCGSKEGKLIECID